MKEGGLSKVDAAPDNRPDPAHEGKPADGFMTRDGTRFAGLHLLVDFHGASRLDDLGHIETALRLSAEAAGATVLHIHLHHFAPTTDAPGGGVSGVAVLAESHMSVHTWPEAGFAALDIFMCGAARPELCLPVLERAFTPQKSKVTEIRRGKAD